MREISYNEIWQLRDKSVQEKKDCFTTTLVAQQRKDIRDDDSLTGSELRRSVYNDVASDSKIDAFIMNYPHGTILRQSALDSLFRGENKRYEESYSFLHRVINQITKPKDKELYQLVADMRIAEFDMFIHKFNRVGVWEKSGLTVLTEPLAQHYGLETNWLDITDDFDTALFFATCKWSDAEKCWHPLTKRETEEDERSKFGVIFQASSMLVEIMSADQIYCHGTDDGAVLPIGYQPFMRCHSQHGYSLHMITPIPLQNNRFFERLYFCHDENLSQAVFDMMDGGNKVYPREGLSDFSELINRIASQNVFSERAFTIALDKNNLTSQKEECKKALRSFVVTIDKQQRGPFFVCNDMELYKGYAGMIDEVNKRDSHFSIEQEYHINPLTRPVFC